MKAHYLFFPALLLCLVGCSSQDDPSELMPQDMEVSSITVNLDVIDGDFVSTRTMSEVYPDNPDRINFTFGPDDNIGIFPSSGDQLRFSLAGTGGQSFTFDGGGWGLKTSYTYAAYIPFNKDNYDRSNSTILLDYSGQTQMALDDASHLPAYDFQASAGVSPNPETGKTSISLKRQAAILVLKLKVPELDKVKIMIN